MSQNQSMKGNHIVTLDSKLLEMFQNANI